MPAASDNAVTVTEAWKVLGDEGRIEEVERYYHPDFVLHAPEGQFDQRQFAEILAAIRTGFPDLVTRVEETVVEGDRVAYRWLSEGTHLGEYMGVPATSRPITATGIAISHFGDDGRIVADWVSWNRASVLHSMGIVPIL
ncbi:MAG TPA: ester cyclase [Acidimicrobiales bacterium]|nr:ester cyclase [Acidimicrobiales bacterium]